jgi:hypothetical protein
MRAVTAASVDAWLTELSIEPVGRAERDGIASWDLELDGRRRAGVRITLILDPANGLLCWVHYAPPLSDSFRVSYRQFLRWNDELPFVKFALGTDEQPVLAVELPDRQLGSDGRDAVGLALARLLAVCDLLLPESTRWLWPGAKAPPPPGRPLRTSPLLERFSAELGELGEPPGDA